jgi:hypothetical protein
MKFIFILRGHIRNSFDDKKLLDFLLKIDHLYELDIYIHTWNIVSNGISHRHIQENTNEVTPKLIYNYFTDSLKKNIKHIIIDDDTKIQLIGSTDGKVIGAPKIGWKNMWYGQYTIINYIKQNIKTYNNEIIINMRFDLLGNYYSGEESKYISKLNELYLENMSINEEINIPELRKTVSNINIFIQEINKNMKNLNKNIEILNNNKSINFDELSELKSTIEIKNDILQNLSNQLISLEPISEKINNEEKFLTNKNPLGSSLTSIIFLDESNFIGIDNFYIGNLNLMLKMTKRFHESLDDIVNKYSNIKHQEALVYYENCFI